jgi:hypothetical protein
MIMRSEEPAGCGSYPGPDPASSFLVASYLASSSIYSTVRRESPCEDYTDFRPRNVQKSQI